MKYLHLPKHLFYSLVILLGVIKSLAFALAVYAEHNSSVIESWISQAVGAPVHFKRIETTWTGVAPRLWLKALSIGDQEVLELGDVLMGVDLPALFSGSSNPPVRLKLTGTRIQLLRERSGETRIVGLMSRAGGKLVLPAHIYLHNAQLEWKDLKHNDVELLLDNIDLHLKSRGDRSQLSIALDNPQGKLHMRADVEGHVLGTAWSADTYIRTYDFNAAELVAKYLPGQYRLEDLAINLQAWNRWHRGHHVSTQSRLQIKPFTLAITREESFRVNKFETDLSYRREHDAWQLQLSDLDLGINDDDWPTTDLAVRMTSPDDGNRRINLGANRVPLGHLSRLLAMSPLSGKQKKLLAALAPRGSAHNLRGSYITTAEGGPEWKFATDIESLGMRAWQRLPGLDNISGHIMADKSRARFDLYSTDARVFLPRLFRTPLPLSLLRGRIDWEAVADGGWVLDSRELVANSPDLKTVNRVRITAVPESPLFLDIQSAFADGRGENAGTYYPVGIMSSNLVQWLDRSVVEGRVPSGSFLLRGPLTGFPYHLSHQGHFEVLFEAEDVTLDYMPQWPPLTQVDAEVRFHNNSLAINARGAEIYDSKVLGATARIPSLKPTAPLEIQGSTLGPLSDQLRLLRETPLSAKFGQQVENISASGPASLTTSFAIPLKPPGKYTFEAVVGMQDNSMVMEDWDLRLSAIQGELQIDLDGISANAIKAAALGTEIEVDIKPSGNSSTLIDAHGLFAFDDIVKQIPAVSMIDASGSAGFAVALEIPGADSSSGKKPRLGISSDLRGIATKMPRPLHKEAAESQLLEVEMPLASDLRDISVKYGEALQLTIAATAENGYLLSGTMAPLVLSEWLNVLHRQPGKGEKTKSHVTNIDFFFKSVDAGAVTATDLALVAHHNDAGWFGYTDSEKVAGSFSLPDDLESQPVRLNFDHLDLVFDPEDEASASLDGTGQTVQNPQDIPALRIKCSHLNVNDSNLGKLQLDARKTPQGLSFRDISLHGELIDIKARGNWHKTAEGVRSRVSGTLATPDMGQLLTSLKITAGVAGAATNIDFDLNWPDALFNPDPAYLSGYLQFDVSAGHFLDIEPGAARVFGLFNFAALQRRLKLDFTDLFKKGFAFDFILADFLLEEGQAYTNNMVIDGPATRIGVAGRTGLADSDFDQLVTVTPRLGAALPLAGTLVGGPVAGLAVLVAQQVVTQNLKKNRGIQYSVHGNWGSPIIKRVKPEPKQTEYTEQSFLE